MAIRDRWGRCGDGNRRRHHSYDQVGAEHDGLEDSGVAPTLL